VKPHRGQSPVDPEPSGNLTFNVVSSLNLLSRVSNSLYTSIRGDALNTNRESVKERLGRDDDVTTTTSVADSFTAIMDDLLVAFGTSQLVNAQDTTEVEVDAVAPGVQIGEKVYIYMVFAINMTIGCFVIYEAARTRFWAGMTAFNFADMKSSIFATSAGGTAIADHISSRSKASTKTGKDVRPDDPRNKAFSEVEIMYSEPAGNAGGRGLPGFYIVKQNEEREGHEEAKGTVHINCERVEDQPLTRGP
jgi:hypothetical protein